MLSRECRASAASGWLTAVVLSMSIPSGHALAAPPTPPQIVRFDHVAHAAKAKTDVACNACHKLTDKNGWAQSLPVGKAGEVHSSCSAAGCHREQFANFRGGRDASLCFTCHVSKLGKQLVFPPYRQRGASDFYLARFSHKDHMREGNKGCQLCHALQKKTTPASMKDMAVVGHDTCGNAICHGERVPPVMSSCEGCHVAKGKDSPVEPAASSEMSPFRVAVRFSHAVHAKVSPKDECGTCHVNAAVTHGMRPPLPPMIACEGCHNGESAFAALGSQCKKCHMAPKEVRDGAK